ncbi:hypothetical protein ITX31_07985 [Arthrobacter gandavensis]|uniref:hypothetical protein n=1 Tax=Arthrobacter gandavensis TaxID=169960 RepID=UPI00188F0038|nr:hypothetical protein [Arthrobacter gandavensis]MBF4994048.1 hypothetical protein [Arthrobacter gandavensis]
MQAQVRLWWLPVGAGGHVVIHTSRWWELWRARRERRNPRPHFHAGLEVLAPDGRYAVEMAPAWGRGAAGPGVVATGAVGLRPLGRFRFFRYEVRCRRNGVIPDLAGLAGGDCGYPVRGVCLPGTSGLRRGTRPTMRSLNSGRPEEEP